MIIEFTRKAKTFTAEVVSKGFFQVDGPESYEVHIGSVVLYIPCDEAKIVG